jgi:broad specificity phosphatase PhoE
MTEKRLLIVRHPETTANVTGRYVGLGDAPFTALGQEQAARLPERIAAWRPDAIWSSPLRRTAVVAQAAAELCGAPLALDVRLTELDFGLAEGLTLAECQGRGITFDFRSWDAPVAPEGESRASIWGRSLAAASDALAEWDRVAFVTHGGVMRSLVAGLPGLPHEAIWSFHIKNAQVVEVRVIDGHAQIEEFVQG